ncbi:ExbD/TolR family protein [Marinobacter lacisalsi]|uniref:ExbD/TolR family protein n=1 Tax=Marinobacter lacisalsi TaxID=475979 RepID=A0ABV8QJR3_9GAMM
MKFQRQRSREVGVDLTPLIDVVFLLLIFLMVSTTLPDDNHLNIQLPEADGEPVTADVELIDLVVNAQGHYIVNGRTLINNRRDTLAQAIRDASGGDDDLPFVITADARTAHEYVIRAMDVAGKLGFTKIKFTTDPTSDEQ